MKVFPVKEIAKEWARKFGDTDGCEEKAYLEGVKTTLDYCATLCLSGSTPSMIRAAIYRKTQEVESK